MLSRYENFLKEFDACLYKYFKLHENYIMCRIGCADCCLVGEYPFSRLEAEYLMHGYTKLLPEIQNKIKQNIKSLVSNNTIPKLYKCPFLINNKCSLYEFRGIVCRTHGLAYIAENLVRLPQCTLEGKNYSEVYDKNSKELIINNPIAHDLRLDKIFKSVMAEKYNLQCGEIRPLIRWFV